MNYERELPPKEPTTWQTVKYYANILFRWSLMWLVLGVPIGLVAKIMWVLVKFGWNLL
jgi:hypothetical protein